MKDFKFDGKVVELPLKHKTLTIDLTRSGNFTPSLLDPSHPVYMLIKQPGPCQRYIQAICDLLEELESDLDVLEFCGGVGMIGAASSDLFHPRSWNSIELDRACVDAYIYDKGVIRHGDMYDPRWIDEWARPWEDTLVYIDWPTNTLRKVIADPVVHMFLDRVFSKKPAYVGITDIEVGWLQMPNHWPHYADLYAEIGIEPSRATVQAMKENYWVIFEMYILKTWGYRLDGRTEGGGGEYYLFVEAA